MMAVVGVVSACGTVAASAPTLEGPGVLTLDKAQHPTPGGEVGGASTEFATAKDLSMWLKLSDQEKDIDRIAKLDVNKTAKGALYLEPKTSAWFDGFRGPFLYQDLAGDIVMHARIKVEGKRTAKPQRKFSLGGLMARVPQSYESPNWMSITTGTTDRPGRVESKITLAGSSKPREVAAKGGWMEFVLGRVGRVCAALYREEGGEWKLADRWPSEFPEVMQWGLTAYTDWDSYADLKKNPDKGNAKQIRGLPDLRMTVDFVRFLRPELPDYADPLNTASVPDDVLIKVLTPADA
jgi:hypothetical protein